MAGRNLKEITQLLLQAQKAGQLEQVLADLLTPDEIQTILERWETLSLLLDGLTHRAVQKKLGISISKVTHAANLLKTGGKGVRKLHKNKA